MKKFLVVAPGYPSEENIYNHAFIHSRVIQYLKNGLDVKVFVVSENGNSSNYTYEGVEVMVGNLSELENHLQKNDYTKILVHFAWKKTIKSIQKIKPDIDLIVWVHGVEALAWYRRLFLFEIKKFYRFIGYILVNINQLLFFRKFIRKTKNVTFVFVSEWMKDILEKDTLSSGKIKNYVIIPNVVDDSIFSYREKSEDDRMKILSIRPYASKKYANDISVSAVEKLAAHPEFEKMSFTFYGDGKLFDETLKPLRKYENVKIFKKFLKQSEIANIHAENGIMLIPTRQDAQGVSMCEAMSSGLVPISSNNTAIPEYLSSSCGYLTNNSDEIVDAILEMYNNVEVFKNKSKNASEHIQKLCSPDVVIKKELDLIKGNKYEN